MAIQPITPLQTSAFATIEGSSDARPSGLSLPPPAPKEMKANLASATMSRPLFPGDTFKFYDGMEKSREGSRRRRKWENDNLVGNPYAQAPIPIDWEIRPTHPVYGVVPYALANLWDARESERISHEREVIELRRQQRLEQHGKHGKATDKGNADYGRVPKELRDRMKRSSSGLKGLLCDLEAEVRRFLEGWDNVRGRDVESVSDTGRGNENGDEWYKEFDDGGSEDSFEILSPVHSRGSSISTITDAVHVLQKEKLVHSSLLDQDGPAKLARFLIHCLGRYYNLDTWTVAKDDPARREAYIGCGSY